MCVCACVRVCVVNRFSHVQLFATLWTIHSPLGSSVHGILQARILEWVAMPSSRGSSRPRDQIHVSCLAGGFFTIAPAAWKAHTSLMNLSSTY